MVHELNNLQVLAQKGKMQKYINRVQSESQLENDPQEDPRPPLLMLQKVPPKIREISAHICELQTK